MWNKWWKARRDSKAQRAAWYRPALIEYLVPFFYLHFIHFPPFYSYFSNFTFKFQLFLLFPWPIPDVLEESGLRKGRMCAGRPFGNVLPLLACELSFMGEVKVGWRCSTWDIQRFPESVCVCVLRGNSKRWQQDGRRSLRRECGESANKCVHGERPRQTE